jgi:hypothetical protein
MDSVGAPSDQNPLALVLSVRKRVKTRQSAEGYGLKADFVRKPVLGRGRYAERDRQEGSEAFHGGKIPQSVRVLCDLGCAERRRRSGGFWFLVSRWRFLENQKQATRNVKI